MIKKRLSTLASLSLITISAYSQKPNIVLFMVDDMGWQDTSVPFDSVMSKWNKIFHTPSMERLAEKGVKFTNAYATPVSTPSRVSLMTGMNVASHGVTNWVGDLNSPTDGAHPTLKMPDWAYNGLQPHGTNLDNSVEATTLPELLSENGYTTINCGKAHFGTMGSPGDNPLKLGFDINIAGNGAGHPASYLAENNYGNATPIKKKSRNAVIGLDKYWGNSDMFLSEALTIEALSTLDSVRKSDPIKPFYLYMSHYAVHTAYEADKRFYQKYRDAGLDHTEAMYAGLIEGMDKSLGDIMDYLDKNNLTQNTIIIFMSDNGGLSAHTRTGDKDRHNWPARSGKGSSLEGGIREPLIVYNPHIKRLSSEVVTPVQITDFLPTILDMASIKRYNTMQELDGVSFVPLLHGKSIKNKPIVWHYPNVWGAKGEGIGVFSAIRKGNYKLIYFYDTEKSELYDLSKDLSEMDNLASKPEYSKIHKELTSDLTKYLKDKKAKLPTIKATGELCSYPH